MKASDVYKSLPDHGQKGSIRFVIETEEIEADF